MVTRAQRYRFSSDEYYKMHEAGIFDEDSPVELIGGEIIQMAAQGHRHAWFLDRFDGYFRESLGRRVVFWSQSTLHLGEGDDPEPDLILLRPDNYGARPPTPQDALLVIEIAETTLQDDRRIKAPLYARFGIPEYWIVDIGSTPTTISVYRNPGKRGYRTVQVVRPGEPIVPQAFPDLTVDTQALLQ